jgi:hypothetical protein
MDDVADHDRILLGNPWIFRNSWLVVKPWDREVDHHTLDFDHVPIWIQLWGLPIHCRTKQMGESIGALLVHVEASEFYEYPGKNVIIKIKVAIDTKRPILSGIHIGNPIDGTKWIDYRYEKLPRVCFKCGMLGHMDKLCRNPALNLETLAPLGPWIRSNQYGRRKLEDKDRKYYSNPSQAKNFGQYSPPVPNDLLEKLAALKVQQKEDPNSSQQSHEQTHKSTTSSTTMESIIMQQEDKGKKAHKLSFNQETQITNNTNTHYDQDQIIQTKRQKMEDSLRAGTARQASPRQ